MGRDHHVAGPARRAGLLLLLAAATGCLGSSPHHAALTASQALAQARADGFRKVYLDPNPAAWSCPPDNPLTRANTATGVYPMYGRNRLFEKPRFQIEAKLPKEVGDGLATIIVLPSASLAARCAQAELGQRELSIPGVVKHPYRLIDGATIVLSPGPEGAPWSPTAIGDFETYLSRDGVLGFSSTDTRERAAMAESELTQLVQQISGS